MTRASLRNSLRSGFTLIELLVVVGIISLLIAILLPSLRGAREQARSVTCLSNLRQIAHGWHMYADENRDISVPGRYANAGGGTSNPANWYEVGNGLKYRPRWIATMGKYVGLFAFNMPRTDFDRQDYDGGSYMCPTVPDRIDERNHAYGYNYQFLGNARRAAGRFINFPVNRTRIKIFGTTVMAGDSFGTAAGVPTNQRLPYENDGTMFEANGNHAWSLDPPRLTDNSDRGSGDAASPRTAVDPRHRGRANVVFCDGHGESKKPQALGYRLLPDGAFATTEVFPDPTFNMLFSGSGRDDDPPVRPGS